MRIDIITLHPELLEGPFSASILKRAIDKKLVQIVVHQLRDYSKDKHKRVDDTQFGGGAGMAHSVADELDCLGPPIGVSLLFMFIAGGGC